MLESQSRALKTRMIV